MKYNPYGKDFVIDRIVLSDTMISLAGLDEVVVSQDINLVNDTEQDWIDGCSEAEVEFEPETEQVHEQELTNLRRDTLDDSGCRERWHQIRQSRQ